MNKLCLIADVKTLIPDAGDLFERCQDYVIPGDDSEAEIVIDEKTFRMNLWPECDREVVIYLESGAQFYDQLLSFNGIMLHASSTVIDGEAYLFAGQCGIGKSTHARLLKELFSNAKHINDDKPAIRYINDKWMVYGTPWCGKDGININTSAPLKAICLLSTRRDRNYIRLASPLKAATELISCSVGRSREEDLKKLTPLLDSLIKDIPIFEMDSLANLDSAKMAYNAMKNELKDED